MVTATTPAEGDPLRLDFSKLRQRRRLMELSQRRLSTLVGAHENAVLYWERGHRRPGILDLVKVARVLGTPLPDLFDVFDQTGNPVDFRKDPS